MKRSKLEIIRDILKIIKENHNSIKPTPLIRKANLSSSRFKKYYTEISQKQFVNEIGKKNSRQIHLTDKGLKFLEKYQIIINFVDEFGL
ncbi:MAG: winged helix-turn-helix domain-containing protein [Candidatus Pacearchaeota archaeon]